MRKTCILDILVIVGLVILVMAALAPAVARVRRSYVEARCQSNMRRLAEAIQAYNVDNGRYFTNRRFYTGTNTPQTVVTSEVRLSLPLVDTNGEPFRSVNGICWVEALYPYLIKIAKSRGQDWHSVFRCPNASSATYPTGSITARVTYVVNFNLLDQYPCLIRDPAKLFMIREVDRMVNSLCRPTTLSNGTSTTVPSYPFLNGFDLNISPFMTANMHGSGSHVLFADGHVHYFSTDYFPTQTWYTKAHCWDAETNQWWNYGPGSGASPPLLKSIAISM